jgi:flavin reductase (DIM6/NTAB) family NADH-FMN oxidoreductase RutF
MHDQNCHRRLPPDIEQERTFMTASHLAPPLRLDRPLEVGQRDWSQREFYLLMSGLVIPRPIGWISTISAAGIRNVAPYSCFNMMGNDPPYVAFGSTGAKDSLANLREVPEFVVNIASMHVLEKVNLTAADFPPDEDEFQWAGLGSEPSAKVRPFRVADAKAHLECELKQVVSDHNTHIVLGRVVHAHVDPSVWKEGRVNPRLLDPICRLGGSAYAALGEFVGLAQPAWSDVKATRSAT